MKVKVLSRNPAHYIRENKSDIHKLHRNLDPSLHPFEGPREYTRALNAVKLERVFAKPFVSSLDGHTDGVNCIARHPRSLSVLLSGSCDGEIRLWSLPRRECLRTLTAHSGFVRGLCVNSLGDTFISIGDDKVIKQWSMEQSLSASASSPDPVNTIIGKNLYHGIDHHWKSAVFATCGEQVDIWDEHRAEPVRSFTWGVDTIHSVKFNPIETHLLASTASDRSIILYDMRGSTPLRKVVMEMRSNTVAWNPLESFIFTAANEDSNLYTFDIRRFNQPINVHMDHVSAVLDVDYSPTGQEFVTGSFDKTIRIYSRDSGRSRCITHEECNACFVFDSVRIPLTSFQEAMKQISEYGKLMLHKNWERLLHGKKQRLTTMPSLRKDSNITLNSSELRGIVTSLRLCSKRPRRKRSYWLQERERRITFVSIVNQEVFHMSPKERNTLSLLSSERTHDHAMCVSGIM